MESIWRRVALVALASLTCSCTDDVLDASYATQAEAVKAGAIAQGWAPSWIPPQAFNLYEVHDVDSNESALAFRLPTKLAWRPPAASCRNANAGEFYEPRFDRDWIPESLDNYDFYSCQEGSQRVGVPLISALAVSKDGRHVLHWRYLAP